MHERISEATDSTRMKIHNYNISISRPNSLMINQIRRALPYLIGMECVAKFSLDSAFYACLWFAKVENDN